MVTSRIWFTAAQKAELWERWKNGQSAAGSRRNKDRCQRDNSDRRIGWLPHAKFAFLDDTAMLPLVRAWGAKYTSACSPRLVRSNPGQP